MRDQNASNGTSFDGDNNGNRNGDNTVETVSDSGEWVDVT